MKKVHRMGKPILYEFVKTLLDLHHDLDDELLLIRNTLLLFLKIICPVHSDDDNFVVIIHVRPPRLETLTNLSY